MPRPAGTGGSGGYSRADRLLHRIALGSRAILNLTFALERSRYREAASGAMTGPPVFVVGSAGAGTAILTRLLHDSGGFASLTWRDMPFPLAPNLWRKLSDRSRRDTARAAHRQEDGIEHDLEPSEAIEEIFWRSREARGDGARPQLPPQEPTLDTIAAFRQLAELVCLRYGRGRYLSHNDANSVRLPAIMTAFPYALLVHPFREPLQHAAWQLEQHRRAIEQGRDHHRAPTTGPSDATARSDRIDHWLENWLVIHRRLLDQPEQVSHRQMFVDYDALCRDPQHGLALLAHLARTELRPGEDLHPPRRYQVEPPRPALLDRARAIHAELVARANFAN
jgi:hypothetical protein